MPLIETGFFLCQYEYRTRKHYLWSSTLILYRFHLKANGLSSFSFQILLDSNKNELQRISEREFLK